MQELILEEKTTLSPVMKEIYRRLRTNLEFTGIENKVICLTSCMENDGKSSVSFNLAKILAENDKRVLFIDADMRNSVLTKRTGIPDELKGLSHYLAGKNAASEVIYATNHKNFYVIPTGRFPKNPTELLNKPAYEVLIEGMKQTFDYVIIDTPPLGSVVDAALIAKTADASVLVISANAVSRRMANSVKDRLPVVNMKSRGLFKHFTLDEEVWYGDGSDLMSLNLFGYTFKPVAEYIMPGEFVWNRKEHGWESDKKNGGVSVRVEFMVDTDISKDKKLMDVMPVSDLKDELNLEETPIVTGECADIISDYINVSHKVQEIYRQYQIYQEALGEWIHYDLDEDNHLVKKYSGAVIDKVTVNKMTKNILHEGMLLVRKAGAFVQKLGLQNETDFLADSMGDNLGFEFMVLAAIYMDHGHWAVEFENGDSFYNLLEMCTVLRTADEEDSADLLKTFTLLKNEMEEQGMDIRHIDHYNMLRNYIYTVADIYKIFFDAIQKKLEAMVVEIDSLVDKNPDFIATEGKFKGCIFYQTDTDSNRVDVFDPSGNIMADFSIFQNEAIRNYEKTRLGIQGAVEHN